jgi:hypothetical protein
MSQYGDGDSPDVCDSEWRKARKPHDCDACGETVQPCQRYHRTSMLFDGAWSVWIRCVRCQAIFAHLSDRIRESGDHEEFCDAELNCGHDYRERWDEDPPPEIAALAFWRPGDPVPGVGT